jgi:hypothetical protein
MGAVLAAAIARVDRQVADERADDLIDMAFRAAREAGMAPAEVWPFVCAFLASYAAHCEEGLIHAADAAKSLGLVPRGGGTWSSDIARKV